MRLYKETFARTLKLNYKYAKYELNRYLLPLLSFDEEKKNLCPDTLSNKPSFHFSFVVHLYHFPFILALE